MFVGLIWFFTSQTTNLSVMSGRVFLGRTSTKLGWMCLAQGHNTVRPMTLEPPAPRSRVKHSTTEALHSLVVLLGINDCICITYPATTECRNLEALSTTSSHTLDTDPSSNKLASGKDWRASRDSCSSSIHRSESSPDLQARRRNAKAKLRAALDPTRASPIVAFSAGFMLL